MSHVDQTIGRYRILERVGRGRMGVLYRGIDPALDREVAIKVMSAEFADGDGAGGEESRTRFFREARAVAKLHHRNIVTIFEFAEEQGVPYIVMELLHGRSLAKRMRAEPPLTLDEKLDIVSELCAGLQFAHEHGVVHRDVKPGNVWLLDDGTVKLLDFGIAKVSSATLARHPQTLGSPSYVAPEQLRGEPVDARVDVFAASVVLYELLSGRAPFASDSLGAPLRHVLQEEPPPLDSLVPDLPAALAAAVAKGMRKQAADRYQSAADLGADLQLIRMSLQRLDDTMFGGEIDSDDTLYGEDPVWRTDVTVTAAGSVRATPLDPAPAPLEPADSTPLSPAAASGTRLWIGALAAGAALLAGVRACS